MGDVKDDDRGLRVVLGRSLVLRGDSGLAIDLLEGLVDTLSIFSL